MFLFASDASLVRSPRAVRPTSIDQLPAEMCAIRANDAVLFWTNDCFTIVERGGDEIAVKLRRPNIDQDPIIDLRWRPAEGSLTCRRRWSGEFSAYLNAERFKGSDIRQVLITSHLKLGPPLLRDAPAPHVWQRIEPGHQARVRQGKVQVKNQRHWSAPFQRSYSDTVREVRRLVLESVASIPGEAVLLLSGGIDSSAVAAAARLVGREVPSFTFALKSPVRQQKEMENDLLCARKVAEYLDIPLSEIRLDSQAVVRNVPLGIYLAETSRGTIVDDCAALVEVARRTAASGFSQVWMGEAADDLLGGFKFALRYHRGAQLRAYYRRQLVHDLPNELAIIQNVFASFGVSVVHPMWTPELLQIGYNLPLKFRLDRRRLMKQVLRDAFAAELPREIVTRPKCVTRDSTQIRYVLEGKFGTERDRYRNLFHIMMGPRAQWPRNLHRLLKRLKR